MTTPHVVQQGEFLDLIARRYGFRSGRALYDHPDNAELRAKRPNPNLLHPGDVVRIPAPREHRVRCATGRLHRFVLRSAMTRLRLVLKDGGDHPIADMAYTLEVAGVRREGTTDGGGVLVEEIPLPPLRAGATAGFEGRLVLRPSGVEIPIRVGHLDPVSDGRSGAPRLTGIQARLNNLGYSCGSVDGIMGPLTRAALSLFQRDALKRPDPDGQPDAETRAALVRAHGC